MRFYPLTLLGSVLFIAIAPAPVARAAHKAFLKPQTKRPPGGGMSANPIGAVDQVRALQLWSF
jgi:hypothetical protein